MNSTPNLTRAVFRALIANRPFIAVGCQRRVRLSQHGHPRSQVPSHPHKRNFFGLSVPSRTATLADARGTPGNLERALGRMVDLVRARRTHSRLPPDKDVLDAFRYLFRSRLETPRPLTRNEIFLATETFTHLKERDLILVSGSSGALMKEDLHNVLLTLATATGNDRFRSDTRNLASHVFNALRQTDMTGDQPQTTEPCISETMSFDEEMFPVYIQVLSKTGSATEALELLQKLSVKKSPEPILLWVSVLKGLANERRDKAFWETLSEMEKSVGKITTAVQEELIAHFISNNDFSNMKRTFEMSLQGQGQPSTGMLIKVLEFCIENDHLKWANSLAQQLKGRQESVSGATLLLWEVAHNETPRFLHETASAMLETSNSGMVNISTFNRLIKYYYSHDKAWAAEETIEIAQGLGLRPNATTYALELNHALDKHDLQLAIGIFDTMLTEDVPGDRSDVQILNRLTKVLCYSPKPDYETIMRIVDRFLDNNIELDTEAVAALCHLFLQRDNLDEAMGLLRHRVDSYPANDRARVAAVFRTFIINPEVQDQRAYNAYEILRHAFPETEVKDRLPLMQSFFDRGRPDLGCLVFGHMRQREDSAARPTPEAYAQCFEGIAQCKDIDGLQMVFNMLKLDQEVEQTTRIHNGLMQAYTACHLPFTAIIDHFWKILDSREGPSLNSFALALRACETWVPQGGQEARKIMALLQHWNVDITKDIYHCYLGALAGNSEFENAVELIESMEEDIGEPPDAMTIGTMYNAIPWQYRKDAVEEWAKKTHPDLWEELMAFGDEVDEEWEIRYFKIDRSIDVGDEPLFGHGEYEPQIVKRTFDAIEG